MPTPAQVTVDGRVVALLTATGGDFPWQHGTYEPGPDAALVASAFVDLPDGRRDLDLDRLAAAGYDLGSVRFDDGDYLHALVVAPDGSAAWRFGFEPLEP